MEYIYHSMNMQSQMVLDIYGLKPLGQWSPTFLAPDIRFVEVNFSVDQVGSG